MAHIAAAQDAFLVEQKKCRLPRAVYDSIIGSAIFCSCAALLVSVDFFEKLYGYTRSNEHLELDEWIASVPALAAVAVWFAFRRWQEAHVLNARLIEASLEVEKVHREMHVIQERRFELEQFETLGRLAAGFSHELNNTFQPAVMLTQLVLRKEPLSDDGRANLETVLEACRCSQDIVEKTMMVVKANRSVRKDIPLAPALRRAVELASGSIPSSTTISAEIEDFSPLASVNETELLQIVSNLLMNSANALPSGGRIVVKLSLQAAADRSEKPVGDLQLDCFRISVTDNGCGMSEETQKHIFDPFFTAGPPPRGTGLGLSIVHRIVSDWNGRISVASEVGKGTRVDIFLPAHDTTLGVQNG